MPNRTILLIEHANFNCALNKIKEKQGISPYAKIDHYKIFSLFTLGHQIIERNMYIGTREEWKNQYKYLDFLKRKGFTLKTKEAKIIRLENGDIKYKANFDVEIAIDACCHMFNSTCDEIILISGDCDFSYLLDTAKTLNVPIKVISSDATISTELRHSANNLILLDDIDMRQYLLQRKI